MIHDIGLRSSLLPAFPQLMPSISSGRDMLFLNRPPNLKHISDGEMQFIVMTHQDAGERVPRHVKSGP
jgi:hypothetical protein